MLKISLRKVWGVYFVKNMKFTIGEWRVDPSSNLLISKTIEKRIEPKVMELLVFLANANGHVVSREAILGTVWQQVVLGDAITNTIANLRKALNDTHTPREYIETIPKQGYRLIPEVKWETDDHLLSKNQARPLSKNTSQALFSKNLFSVKQIVIAFFILVMLFIFYKFIPRTNSIADSHDKNLSKTVAVLPFYVYSEQKEMSNFAEGLADELIHQLATNHDLQVVARSSSSKFENSDKSVAEIAKILGTQYIIEGSLRQNNDNLRITVQLIDANRQINLWSKSFDKKIDDNFLQTQISISREISQIITHKDANSSQYEKRNHPNSAKAYKLFMLAQSYMKRGDSKNYEKAFIYYQKATVIAPDYALAFAGMAQAKILLYQYKHKSLEKTEIEASKYLLRALSIEPELAEAFAARGLLRIYLHKFDLAENDLKKAIELNPGLRIAHHNYGFLLWRLSRSKEALVQFKSALEIDPLSPITNYGYADTLVNLGRIEEAIEHYLNCQDFLPENSTCFGGLSGIYSLLGNIKLQTKYRKLSRNLDPPNDFAQMLYSSLLHLQLKHWDEARKLIELSAQHEPLNYFLLKTDFTLNLHLNTLEKFKDKLQALSLDNPGNFEINLLLGMTLYFQSKCHQSIMQYEQAARTENKTTMSIWEFEHGISHNLNLAYCYSQRNNFAASEEELKKFNSYIMSLPKSKYIIPGKIYNVARYLVLTGEPIEAKKLLKQIEWWPFYWLSNYDPVLADLKEFSN